MFVKKGECENKKIRKYNIRGFLNLTKMNLPNFTEISSHHSIALFASKSFSKLRQV